MNGRFKGIIQHLGTLELMKPNNFYLHDIHCQVSFWNILHTQCNKLFELFNAEQNSRVHDFAVKLDDPKTKLNHKNRTFAD